MLYPDNAFRGVSLGNGIRVLRHWYIKTKRHLGRHKITVAFGLILIAAFTLASLVLAGFLIESASAVHASKEELFVRNLRDVASRLDLDERLTLQANIPALLSTERRLTPVVVPRQYYSAPQGGYRFAPKHPPRNCFVNLLTAPNHEPTDDKICSYFAESSHFGSFLFVVAEFTDTDAVPLRYGDRTFSSDYLKLGVTSPYTSISWKLAPQVVPGLGRDRFLVTAFRERGNGAVELDKRVEGWAVHQAQVFGTNRWVYYLRIDFRQFASSKDPVTWPPNPADVELSLGRQDRNATGQSHRLDYDRTGRVELSVASLVVPLLENHGHVKVKRVSSQTAYRIYEKADGDRDVDSRYIYLSGQDINIRNDPIRRHEAIQDTDVVLEVSHPGIVIEKRVWLLFAGVFPLVLLTAASCIFAYRRLLRPISVWSALSKQISARGTTVLRLPFGDRFDEIGTLARSFNALLAESSRQVRRERTEIEFRSARLSVQERNFHIIGHEIRSPLQALSAIVKPGDEGRRYIDRIMKALPYLERVYTIEDSVTNRDAHLRKTDLVVFLHEIVANTPRMGIDMIELDSKIEAGICRVDPESLEDVLENLIRNANRHRANDTAITVGLDRIGMWLILSVTNEGQLIPVDHLARIFDYGFSTTEGEPGRVVGIGLSMSRQHILKMRGRLEVENLEPNRVRFTISIPEEPHESGSIPTTSVTS